MDSNDTGDSDIRQALQLAEEIYCPVWAMLKNNVEIVTEYRIVASKRDWEPGTINPVESSDGNS